MKIISGQKKSRSVARVAVLVFLPAAGMLLGCHLDMYDQPRYKPLAASTFFGDSASSRLPVEGTVARGQFITDSLLATGKVSGRPATLFPFPITDSVVERGQDRFNTFCSPCHGRLADGRGMIVQRGFPAPPSFHTDSMMVQPPGFFFDVITNGFGRMYSYAPSIPINDRWAIVAYIRALQLSQKAQIAGLPADDRKHVQEVGK